jgi:hypothetical protein
LTYFRLPLAHRKHMKSTNMLERLNEEIRRRTYVVRIVPNAESCLRLIRALTVERHEAWLEDHRYLNMDPLEGSTTSGRLSDAQAHQGDEPPLSAASLATPRFWTSERRRLRGDGLAGPHDRFELDAQRA